MNPLDQLQQQSLEFWTSYKRRVSSSFAYKDLPYQEVLDRIEGVFLEFIRSVMILNGKIQVASSNQNSVFDAHTGVNRVKTSVMKTLDISNKKHAPKIARLLKTASLVYPLVLSGTHCSKRQIYYKDTELFKNQLTSDNAIDDLCDLLQVPRCKLNIMAKSKGLIAGAISFVEEGQFNEEGTLIRKIPADVDSLSELSVTGLFILVVEKETILHRLVEENFLSRQRAILVTGCGYPDLSTRMLLRRLVTENSWLPILVLTDADPHGYQILSTYCFGSAKKAGECDRLALPFLHWLGLTIADARPECCVPLTTRDFKKLYKLLDQPQLSLPHYESWRENLLAMERSGYKCELDSLVTPGQEHLADYVDLKLSQGSWV